MTSRRSGIRLLSCDLKMPRAGSTEPRSARPCSPRREVLASREEGDRMIILISDGYSYDISNGKDEEIARQMKADNIVVYAVHVASNEVPGEVVNIAMMTGGEVFEPGDKAGLAAVFKRIDEMQETRMEKNVSESMDHFRPFRHCRTDCHRNSQFRPIWITLHPMVAELATLAVVLVATAGEFLHARRVSQTVERLAFRSPYQKPALWAQTTPVVASRFPRACAPGASMVLLELEPKVHHTQVVPQEERRHVLLALDVSPSMRLQDAGPEKENSRMKRARDVMESFFRRVPTERYRVSVIAFYTGAKAGRGGYFRPRGRSKHLSVICPCTTLSKRERPILFAGIAEAAEIARSRGSREARP